MIIGTAFTINQYSIGEAMSQYNGEGEEQEGGDPPLRNYINFLKNSRPSRQGGKVVPP